MTPIDLPDPPDDDEVRAYIDQIATGPTYTLNGTWKPIEATLTLDVKMAPLWKRLVRLPAVLWGNYRRLRTENGRIVSIYAAWLMAGMVIRFHPGGQEARLKW